MQKIMFNDKYGLTQAVLEGRKTMTRRIAQGLSSNYNRANYGSLSEGYNLRNGRLFFRKNQTIYRSVYAIGEIVAVAQSLRDMGYDPRDTKHKSGAIWGLDHTPAWTNKMFVSASECIHQIRITNVRAERLQDISDQDCLREGIIKMTFDTFSFDSWKFFTHNPREAFAALIDKISGKGTWDSNPLVFVYEFELLK